MDNELLTKFLNYIAVEKGLARNTLESYERDVRRYLESMGTRGPDNITGSDVVSFLSRLYDEGIATSSVARCLSAVRGFHKYLVTDGHARGSYREHRFAPRMEKRPAKRPSPPTWTRFSVRDRMRPRLSGFATRPCLSSCTPPGFA